MSKKLLFALLVALISFARAEAQVVQKNGDLYELSFTSHNPTEVHGSANAFAQQIGDVLKYSYPSKVIDPSVRLQIFEKDSQKYYRLIWSCRIVKVSTVAEADYYFDRRGTLLPGTTLAEARSRVEAELQSSDKVSKMRAAFRGGKIPVSFIRDSFAGSAASKYWYIKEFFLVAPK